MNTPPSSPLQLPSEEYARVCAVLAKRMETLMQREHARVMYIETLAQQISQSCSSNTRSWLARIGVMRCSVTQRCLSDMGASVTMALHLMLMELHSELSQGQGVEHPLAQVLMDRLECEHDEVIEAMRLFFYQKATLVQEGLMHHQINSKVVLNCTDIERWIKQQSRLLDSMLQDSYADQA